MRIIFKVFIFLLITYNLQLTTGYADTVKMKNGREVGGIVVEDYHDRLVISTPDGERQVNKSDIMELSYDTEEYNLISLGEQAKDRGDYAVAYAYYDKAFKMNPASRAAKDGVVHLQGLLFRMGEARKEEDVRRREEFERYQGAPPESKTAEEAEREEAEKVRSSTGVVLKQEGSSILVDEVIPGSPAADAGIIKKDQIAAIWGRLTGYMDRAQVIKTLCKQASIEIKTMIERGVVIRKNKLGGVGVGVKEVIGLSLSMEFDGLTAAKVEKGSPADVCGLKPGDLISSINGASTRYMPLKKATDLIVDNRANTVNVRIRREVIIWRKP